MKKKYLVSIIIVNYNTYELTQKCIETIYKFEKEISYQIILVDNNSSDGSQDKFDALEKKYKNFKFIKSKQNLGFAKGNNLGIKVAQGKYVFLLNSDTELIEKNTISKLVNFVKNSDNTNVGAVVPKLLNSDYSEQGSVLYLPTLKKAFFEFVLKRKKYFGLFVPKANTPTKVEAAVMAAFLITPEGLKKVGFLDERYFMYFEDLQYCKDLRKSKLDIYFLPDIKILHHHGASGKKLAVNENQWKRQIPSSKIYHGVLIHYLIYFIMYLSQKYDKFFVK